MKKVKLILTVLMSLSILSGCNADNGEKEGHQPKSVADTAMAQELETSPNKSLYMEDEESNKKVYNLELSSKLFNDGILLEWNSDEKHDSFYIYIYNKDSDEYIFQTNSKSNRLTLKQYKDSAGEYQEFESGKTYDIFVFADKNRKTKLGNNESKITFYSNKEVPQAITVSSTEEGIVNIKWNPAEDAINYAIYGKDDFKEYYAKQTETTNTEISLNKIINQYGEELSLEPGFRYSFCVTAQKSDGTWTDLSRATWESVIVYEHNEEAESEAMEMTEQTGQLVTEPMG